MLYFLGYAKLAKAKSEDCYWCMLGFLDREVFPVSAGCLRYRFVMWDKLLGWISSGRINIQINFCPRHLNLSAHSTFGLLLMKLPFNSNYMKYLE